jgi:hypothetical protein
MWDLEEMRQKVTPEEIKHTRQILFEYRQSKEGKGTSDPNSLATAEV